MNTHLNRGEKALALFPGLLVNVGEDTIKGANDTFDPPFLKRERDLLTEDSLDKSIYGQSV